MWLYWWCCLVGIRRHFTFWSCSTIDLAIRIYWCKQSWQRLYQKVWLFASFGIFPLSSTYLVLCFIILAETLKIDFNLHVSLILTNDVQFFWIVFFCVCSRFYLCPNWILVVCLFKLSGFPSFFVAAPCQPKVQPRYS